MFAECVCALRVNSVKSFSYGADNVAKGKLAPPAGLEPAIFGLEVRRLVH